MTIIEELPPIPRKSRGVYRMFKCKCDCGNIVSVRLDHLRDGHTTSCGCENRRIVKETHTKHGLYKHPIYLAWINIKARCYNYNNPEYCYYGGRGICLCDEWMNNFESFYNWSIENGWNKSLTIDRINNDKDYSPDNCRWTNYKIQLSNTSRTHHIRYNNKKYNIRELSDLLNISYDKLYYRIIQLGWDVDKTINYYNKK